jgi:hypothetical protein
MELCKGNRLGASDDHEPVSADVDLGLVSILKFNLETIFPSSGGYALTMYTVSPDEMYRYLPSLFTMSASSTPETWMFVVE